MTGKPGTRHPDDDRIERLRGPLAWMAKNSVAANLLMFCLLVGGLLMMSRIKQEVFPEFELDLVLVQVPYPGAGPTEVEEGICLPIEESIRGLEGVKEVRSTATEGVAVIAVELIAGTDGNRALSDVKAAVDRLTALPEDSERPIVSLAATRQRVVSVIVYGDHDEAALRRLANDIREDLLTDDRITYVDLTGIRPLEISVDVPREELRRHGLTLSDVAGSIRRASVDIPGGGVKTSRGEVLLRTTERRERGQEFADIIVKSDPDGTQLRLRDLAHIEDGFKDLDQESSYDGQPAVMINVYRVGDETPISVSDAVRAYVERNADSFPDGIHLTTWSDRSVVYRDRINLLLKNATYGLFLVMLTLGLFLDVRLAFWVTLGIPISFLGALFFLPSLDATINMISLFAFIVSLGMVVDDAIVIGEAIHTERQRGHAPLAAAILGVQQMAGPIIFAILTTCMAFLPLAFISGMMGKFFGVIPVIVITVLLISLVESLVILPAHLAHTKLSAGRGPLGMLTHQQQRFARLLDVFIRRAYEPSARFFVRYRYATAAVGVLLFLGALGMRMGGHIDYSMMPKIDGDNATATVEMPYGSSVQQTRVVYDRLIATAQETLEELGGASHLSKGIYGVLGSASESDRGGSSGRTAEGGHLAQVRVGLVQSGERDFSTGDFVQRWREHIGEIPGAESLAFGYAIGASQGAAIDVELSHPNMEVLQAAASRLATSVGEYDGVKDINDGFELGKEQLDLRLLPEARSLGLTESDLARQVRDAFYGSEAVRQQRGRDEVRVFVRLPEAERRSLNDVEQMILRTPSGGEIPLSEAAVVSSGRSFTQIQRTDGRRVVHVTADIEEGRANAEKVSEALFATTLPNLAADYPGLSFAPGGEQKESAEAMSSLAMGFVMAVIAMLALLAIPFRSYAQPFLVVSAIPFGFVGALLGHLIMGYDLSIMSLMGIVALSGVVVNDSLILVVAINEFRAEGLPLNEALVQGGARRFRPILLTSLTTFFGLVPMIAETSVQARFLIPMAISLGFGVLFATFITLVLVPALYGIMEDAKGAIAAVVAFARGPGGETSAPTEPGLRGANAGAPGGDGAA